MAEALSITSLFKSMSEVASEENLLEDKDTESASAGNQVDDAAAIQRYLSIEESVRPALHGVLGVKIRSVTMLKFERKVTTCDNHFCVMTIRNFIKRTRVVRIVRGAMVWDQTKHFPVTIVRNRRHPYNLLRIRVMGFDGSKPERQLEMGSIAFHLHDLIQASPIAGTYDLWNDHLRVGDIDIELTFNYGMFGYGYSFQLREDDTSPQDLTQYSLLPRIMPRKEIAEANEPVLAVRATPHPVVVPIRQKAYLSYGREIKPLLNDLEETQYQPSLLMKEMNNLSGQREKYYSNSDRIGRLMFLHNHLLESSNQPESIFEPDQAEGAGEAKFPSKNYTRFVVPGKAHNS
ncbi:hypothetical protein BJ742DRAFT_822187 [Cladochytrium replicatum]|nr:hypothetical protein BJ742DRAFT_822187 [Cladochytrium replicatum]